ncbi:MAG: M23 family metallopeptidase [Proteobacteria bacterium]|nr:M23 family metallopeptidase [Pseudomonadota bacterium]
MAALRYARIAVAGASLVLAAGAPTPSAAGGINLEGIAIQGSLMIGRVEVGAKLWLDDVPVPVARNGEFLLGFGRNAGREAHIKVTFPGGRTASRLLNIEQREFEIERIDGLEPKKVTPSPEDLDRIRAEKALINKARALFTEESYFRSGFIWPVQGRVSGVYGSQRVLNGEARAPHLGVDIAAPKGSLVVASADGVVSLAYNGMFFSGNVMVIDHGLGLGTIYAHLERLLVKEGQKVEQGQPIGTVGATGRVTGPHLHWGVNLFRVGLDPALLVPPMPAAGK